MFRIEPQGDAVRLVIDRPDARNAIPLDGWDRLAETAEQIARHDPPLVVLTGAGGAFCAGADLKDLRSLRGDQSAAARFRLAMQRAIEALAALQMPLVASIEGPCFGAGVALAMACDFRIALSGARFAITPAKIGISYPQGDVERLVRLVGIGQAAHLLLTAGTIDGAEALRIGLVEASMSPDEAAAMLANMAALAPESLRALKAALRTAAGSGDEEGRRRDFERLAAGEELARRLEAFGRRN